MGMGQRDAGYTMAVQARFKKKQQSQEELDKAKRPSGSTPPLDARSDTQQIGCFGTCWSALLEISRKRWIRTPTALQRMLNTAGITSAPAELEDDVLKRLLVGSNQANVGVADDRGRNALHRAAMAGHSRVCHLLLTLAAGDVPAPKWCSAADKAGWTALHHAAANGHASCCERLLNSACFTSASACNKEGRTALHLAALAGHAGACEVLLRTPPVHEKLRSTWGLKGRAIASLGSQAHGAGLSPSPSVATSASSSSSSSSSARSRAWAFEPINALDAAGVSALHLAVDSGSEACVQALCNSRIRAVNVASVDSLGSTALHRAATRGCLDLCVLLLRYHTARLCSKVDRAGNTVLHVAAMHRHDHICKVLLENRRFSMANSTNHRGRTALHEAVLAGSLAVCHVLARTKRAGAFRQFQPFVAFATADEHGRTALHLSVSAGSLELTQAMLDLLPSHALQAKDVNGQTALHYAALAGNDQIFQAIVDDRWFASADEVDGQGSTAWDLARGDVLPLIQSMYSQHSKRQTEAHVIEAKFV